MKRFTLKSNYVTDTVGLILRMERRKMGAIAKSIFESAERGKTVIHIPTMVFAEMLYLYEKRRISVSPNDIATYMVRYPNYKDAPMDFAVIQAAANISDIPELHDRLIAATAKALNFELITNDHVIQASSFVNTVW